jgi:hypothetical protein
VVKKISYKEIAQSQKDFYGSLHAEFGRDIKSVSSETEEHKKLRFSRLLNPIFEQERSNRFSIHDVGFGLAALYRYLCNNFDSESFDYSGSEILDSYVNDALEMFPHLSLYCRDINEEQSLEKYDWIILSGVFHQRRKVDEYSWNSYFEATLRSSFEMCSKGIAFNIPTSFVDYRLENIFYPDFGKTISFVASNLSRFFQIQHNYPLFESTVHVMREPMVKEMFPQLEFSKYFKS